MSIPLRQVVRVGAYIVRQHLAGRKRYPLVLMLEPLFRCNLACAGCGKIDYPDAILDKRISVADALAAAGGLTQFAHKNRIYVVRPRPQPARIHFTYDAVTKSAGKASQFRLQPGDVLIVPQSMF